jgi:hypothetical protein
VPAVKLRLDLDLDPDPPEKPAPRPEDQNLQVDPVALNTRGELLSHLEISTVSDVDLSQNGERECLTAGKSTAQHCGCLFLALTGVST